MPARGFFCCQPAGGPVLPQLSENPRYKIALLAHSPEVCDLVQRAMLGYNCEFFALVPNLDNMLLEAKNLLAEGYEGIIYHGNSRHPVFTELSGSAAPLERTHMDIIRALLEVRKISRQVALTSYVAEEHDVELLQSLLDMHVHIVTWGSWEELKSGIEQAYAKGVRVAVGGGATRQFMEQCGGSSVIVTPTENNIQAAIRQVLELARNKRIEAAMRSDLSAVLRHVDDGVVCIDMDGQVVFSNQAALRMLSIQAGEGEGALRRHYDDLMLSKVIAGESVDSERIVAVKNKQIIVDAFPVFTYGMRKGAVALFRDVDSLQNISRKIGAALYRRGFVARYSCADIKGESPPMRRVVQKIKRYGPSDASVHIVGETGTGKELVAHALHQESPRRGKPFVAVNCAALPETLLESELFGYEEGAFTGAKRGGKAGLFEMAGGGTLFLDEITEVSPALQLRLLRVLEAKELMRVGGDRILPVDVRVVSASQRPFMQSVSQGSFRADLFYRLAVLHIAVPPLRERLSDLPSLAQGTLARHGKTPACLGPRAMALLRGHSWPGNVRELLAVMESYCTLLEGNRPDETLFAEIFCERTGLPLTGDSPAGPGKEPVGKEPGDKGAFKEVLGARRREMIEEAIRLAGGNKRQAARDLGISYNTLWRVLAAGRQPEQSGAGNKG